MASPTAPVKALTHEEEAAILAAQAIALAFGAQVPEAQDEAKPKPVAKSVAKPTTEADEAAALAKQAVALYLGAAA